MSRRLNSLNHTFSQVTEVEIIRTSETMMVNNEIEEDTEDL